ncbi:MAG: hypothetical protein IT440_14220 [Phycisphaeraceae bacterium]|nr:hypothetical protein [Phycisphaeraceae bacterium]
MNQSIWRWVHLVRPELAFSAVSNAWLVTALGMPGRVLPAGEALPPSAWEMALHWPLAAAIALGLTLYGIYLNDLLDIRHDRAFRPQRPLPSGWISSRGATMTATLGLVLALGAASFVGRLSSAACVLTALAILFYNATGKYLPAVGLVSLGLIRALMMLTLAPDLIYTWPVCLVLSHVIFCSTLAYGIEGKRPRLHGGDAAQVFIGWAFWMLLLVGGMVWRDGLALPGHSQVGILPMLAVTLFVVGSWRILGPRLTDLRARRALAGRYHHYAMAWLIVYDIAWLIGMGRWGQAMAHGVLLLLALGAAPLATAMARHAEPLSYRLRPM